MNLFKIKYCLLITLILFLLLIFTVFYNKTVSNNLEKKIHDLEKINRELTAKNSVLFVRLDSLSKLEPKIIDKIKIIKIKENEAINAVDTMSISSLQCYFSDRYKK